MTDLLPGQSVHSIIFDYDKEYTKHTYKSFYLIPTSRPFFAPPQIKSIFVDVPGMDGHVDMTDGFLGRPAYGPRSGSFEFAVNHSEYGSDKLSLDWHDELSRLKAFFKGDVHTAVLEDDPYYYYVGRFSLSEWNSQADGTWSVVNIDYNVEPYKYSINDGNYLYLPITSPINAQNYLNISVTGYTKTITVGQGNGFAYCPEIYIYEVTDYIRIRVNNTYSYDFSNPGSYRVKAFTMQPNTNYRFEISGRGRLDIRCKEVRL